MTAGILPAVNARLGSMRGAFCLRHRLTKKQQRVHSGGGRGIVDGSFPIPGPALPAFGDGCSQPSSPVDKEPHHSFDQDDSVGETQRQALHSRIIAPLKRLLPCKLSDTLPSRLRHISTFFVATRPLPPPANRTTAVCFLFWEAWRPTLTLPHWHSRLN